MLPCSHYFNFDFQGVHTSPPKHVRANSCARKARASFFRIQVSYVADLSSWQLTDRSRLIRLPIRLHLALGFGTQRALQLPAARGFAIR